jgi:outer membrane protein
VQYQFLDPNGRVHGYAGIGMAYAGFVRERTSGAWAGAALQLESSLGAAVHAGLDLDVGGGWTVSIDARWFDIDAEPLLNGRGFGTVEIDPYAVGMTIGRRL